MLFQRGATVSNHGLEPRDMGVGGSALGLHLGPDPGKMLSRSPVPKGP